MTLQRLQLPDLAIHAIRAVPFGLVALLAVILGASPDAARAHVDIDVGDGQYVMEVGFRDEPAYLGQPNAVYLHVGEYGTGGTEPVEGLAGTLTVEVEKDGQTLSPPLLPMGDGAYEAVFVPTETGDYTFHISGSIGEATIDESVTSGPQTFNSVEPMTPIEFPVPQPDSAALTAAAQSAQADADTARTIGIIGIVVGLLGLILAGVAFARAGRSAAAPRPAASSEPTGPAEPSGKLIR